MVNRNQHIVGEGNGPMKARFQVPTKPNNRIPSVDCPETAEVALEALDIAQVVAIDRAVRQVGEFGEIHLIVKRGQVRFIGTLKTEALGPDS